MNKFYVVKYRYLKEEIIPIAMFLDENIAKKIALSMSCDSSPAFVYMLVNEAKNSLKCLSADKHWKNIDEATVYALDDEMFYDVEEKLSSYISNSLILTNIKGFENELIAQIKEVFV